MISLAHDDFTVQFLSYINARLREELMRKQLQSRPTWSRAVQRVAQWFTAGASTVSAIGCLFTG